MFDVAVNMPDTTCKIVRHILCFMIYALNLTYYYGDHSSRSVVAAGTVITAIDATMVPTAAMAASSFFTKLLLRKVPGCTKLFGHANFECPRLFTGGA